MIQTSNYLYNHGELELHGFLALDEHENNPRPAVMVVHDWSGRNTFSMDKAEQMAHLGYVGLAIDMYGQGRQGETNDEKMALMQPLMNDRRLLRARIQAGLDALLAMPEVDNERIAAIGFCFGGLCVLDLARSGADIAGVVSVHGLLNKPDDMANHAIKAKILALHGYEDPMVKPDNVRDFCDEMTQAEADWQVHMYGLTQHAFTNPLAHDDHLGLVFDPKAAYRAHCATTNFLKELFTVSALF